MRTRHGRFLHQLGLVAALLVSVSASALAQAATITGRVVDAARQQPLSNSRVFLLGTTLVATTNAAGEYALRGVPTGVAEIRVIRVGYAEQKKPVTVQAGETATVDFALRETATQLEAIVTTATGDQRRAEVGHTIPTIDVNKRTTESPIASMAELLIGQAPGAVVLPGTMTATAGTIRLRGLNSLSLGNAPIWIVDGVRFNAGSTGIVFGGNSQSSTLQSSLNPDEIEKLEIVKGPAAAALYGTDAGNGVIVVTTKRGAPGKTRWNWYTEQGVVKDRGDYPDSYMIWGHTPANPTVQTRCELTTLASGACIRDSVTSFNPVDVDELTPLQTGYRSQYGTQVSGGTNALRFFVSGELEDEDGLVKMPKVDRDRMLAANTPIREEWAKPEFFGRMSARANLNAALNDRFDLDVTSVYIKSHQRMVNTDNNSYGYQYQTSMNPGFRGAGPGKNPNDPLGRPLNGNNNFVIGDLLQAGVSQDIQRFIGSVSGNWRPLSWLSADGTIGVDLADRRDFDICRFGECPPAGQQRLGSVSSAHTNNRNISTKFSAAAVHQPRPWLNLRSTAGVDYVNIGTDGTSSSGSQLPPGAQTVGSAAVRSGGSTLPTATKTLGMYVQEHASFRDRVFVTLSARSDKNSAFGVNYKNAIYPSASVSWIASDEEFFPTVPGLSYLRLRMAYGTAGVNPGATAALDQYNPEVVNIAGTDTPGLLADDLGNSKLRPEVSSEFEGGFDSRLFGDRLNFDLTFYNKRTKDALLSVQLAPSSAASDLTILKNIASVRNRGIEATLSSSILAMPQFGWDVTLAGSRNDNKVLSLGGEPTIGTGTIRDSVGMPINGLYLRRYTYSDANNDGYIVPTEIVVDNDVSFVGSTVPLTTLSLTNSFDFLNRALRVVTMFDYKGDFYVENSTWRFLCTNNAAGEDRSNPNASLEEQARCQAARAGRTATGAAMNTTYGYNDKADFVRFRELSATYRLPANAVRLTRASDASISLGARNIAIWTGWSGTDPEQNYSTGDTQAAFMTASPRSTFTFRLNLTY